MKKRFFTFLLIAVLFSLTLPTAAFADVIIEPSNDFFSRHRDECFSIRRNFYANGEGGYISLKREPGSISQVAVLENGEIIHIMYTYEYKGQDWGVTEIPKEGESYSNWTTGWVPMSQLALVYDYITFAAEHESEFYAYTGSYDMLFDAENVVFWTWPGSGEIAWTLESEWRNKETDVNFLIASHAYKDEAGREWGFFGYVYGNRNTWVCLSDPENTEIPAFNSPPAPDLWPSDGRTPSGTGLSAVALAAVLVIALIIVTAVLIRVFWKPKCSN